MSGTSKFAAALSAGTFFRTASGEFFRVRGKFAGAAGVSFLLTQGKKSRTVTAAELPSLLPLTKREARFASAIIRYAYNSDIDSYVKAAIRLAGLPVDETMNWAKYLFKIYSSVLKPLTTDDYLIDEAIRDQVVDELYMKRILSEDSPYSHFDADKAPGKDLASKVTAYLAPILKGRAFQAKERLQRSFGGGMSNIDPANLPTAHGLEIPNEDSEGGEALNHGDMGATGEGTTNKELEYNESHGEVVAFCKGFLKYLDGKKLSKGTKAALETITKLLAKGEERDEIREYMSTKFRRDGKPLNDQGMRDVWKVWVKEIKAYAASSDQSAPSLMKAIKHNASLKFADLAQPGQPPANPNVQQQQTLKQHIENPQTPQAQNPPTGSEFQTQSPAPGNTNPSDPSDSEPSDAEENGKHINPGVSGYSEISDNHTASEKTMKQAGRSSELFKRSAAAKVRSKFATLRRVAEEQPAEAAEALTQFTEKLKELADGLSTVADNLDFGSTPKEASVTARVRARARFARAFRRIAEENPEEIKSMFDETYAQLDELVEQWENFSDHMGIELSPVESTDVDAQGIPTDVPAETGVAETAPADAA